MLQFLALFAPIGRLTRRTYWLAMIALPFLPVALGAALGRAVPFANGVFTLAAVYIAACLNSKRLRTIGKSQRWLALWVSPFIVMTTLAAITVTKRRPLIDELLGPGSLAVAGVTTIGFTIWLGIAKGPKGPEVSEVFS